MSTTIQAEVPGCYGNKRKPMFTKDGQRILSRYFMNRFVAIWSPIKPA